MIDLEQHDGVYVVYMRDGENRFNRRWLTDFDAALDTIEADPAASALVTTGEGKFFSNGLDLDWLVEPGAEPMAGFVVDTERFLARLIGYPLLTVAACNGHAFAGGAMLALCHDYRVMRADRGYFCVPEVDLKIPFTPGMDAVIKSRLTVTTAHEAMITGKRYGGMEAEEKHIVHAAVAEELVLSKALELAAEHGGKDRAMLGTIKRRMYAETIELLSNSSGTELTR